MEKSLGEIKKYIKSINKKIDILKEKYQKDYTKIPPYEYIWAVLSKGIVSRSEGLMEIIEKLEGEKIKKIASDTLRNILEEYFYLKVLTLEKNEAKKNLKAFTGLSSEKNKKHLKGILRMYESGKAEPLTDPNRLLSIEGLKNKIAEYDNILENLSEEEIKLKNIYTQAERLCQEYDTKKQIISTENGKEDESLEWLYQIIYRYLSGSAHQRLEFKEDSIFGKEQEEDQNHIIVTLSKILQETDSLYKD